jgi:hypothetical protein
LFYEMRLARVTEELNHHPEDLGAYDDSSVACDRIGRGDDAILWMEKKRSQLETLDPTLPEVAEHLYRYHANLGTFLVHRWARQGSDRARIDEVKAARDEIARALETNPNAHFGRETYQLRALEWIIDPPDVSGVRILPNLLGWSFDDISGDLTDPQEADDAVRGLSGLIVLGNAWESVDIFHALNVALQRDSLGYQRGREGGRNTLAHLAWLRCRELIDSGKGSFLPSAPHGEALKALLPPPGFVKAAILLNPAFPKLRAEADDWHEARTAFMMSRLEAGRHPDTDPMFWNGYTDRPVPGLPTRSVPDAYDAWQSSQRTMVLLALIGVLLATALMVGLLVVRSARARRRKPHSPSDPFGEPRTEEL